jgi:hypothetical protein
MALYGNSNQPILTQPELAASMTGSWVTIGTLLQTPVKIIFDNQGSASTAISTDGGTTTWRTFPGGEAILLDNDIDAFPKGTTFSGNGASGVFSISYLYIRT